MSLIFTGSRSARRSVEGLGEQPGELVSPGGQPPADKLRIPRRASAGAAHVYRAPSPGTHQQPTGKAGPRLLLTILLIVLVLLLLLGGGFGYSRRGRRGV
jgi:hypothetical protein